MGFAIIIMLLVFLLFLLYKIRKANKNENINYNMNITVDSKQIKSSDDYIIEYVDLGNNLFTIGSNLNFPLTISNIKQEYVDNIINHVKRRSVYNIKEWFTHLIAKENISCKEIDEWVNLAKPKVKFAIEQNIKASKEWENSSDLDKVDILADIESEVIENLEIRPADTDVAWALLFDKPQDVTIDDKLLDKFNGDNELYQTFMYSLSFGDKVMVVPVDDYRRKMFEALVDKGFLRRGQNIPVDKILETMTMKAMQVLAGSDVIKFTRKQKAIDFLKTLPDIKSRLEKNISFRELFQVNKMHDIDISEIKKSYHYSRCVADVILDTLLASWASENIKDSNQDEFTMCSDMCCPSCNSKDGQVWNKIPNNLPPYHIGCNANVV